MPFVAICRKCRCVMLEEKLYQISDAIVQHFREAHNEAPRKSPYSLDFDRDFSVYYATPYHPRSLWDVHLFRTKRFISDDYCIAVITWENYNRLVGEQDDKRKFLELSESYFGDIFS